mmetsp:Transcript_1696/g.3536  ORF Transcript_1696/g.3536 Transcript_1696/m.3536 type:complete len:215 (+) Transcript_1696:1487-2131(+)
MEVSTSISSFSSLITCSFKSSTLSFSFFHFSSIFFFSRSIFDTFSCSCSFSARGVVATASCPPPTSSFPPPLATDEALPLTLLREKSDRRLVPGVVARLGTALPACESSSSRRSYASCCCSSWRRRLATSASNSSALIFSASAKTIASLFLATVCGLLTPSPGEEPGGRRTKPENAGSASDFSSSSLIAVEPVLAVDGTEPSSVLFKMDSSFFS